jgi:hypothetical protein
LKDEKKEPTKVSFFCDAIFFLPLRSRIEDCRRVGYGNGMRSRFSHLWMWLSRIAFALMISTYVSGCTDDHLGGSLTTTVYHGNPDIFMMGQSNANSDLARAIRDETQKSIHQINHGGQPIQHWLEAPYRWLDMDMAFLNGRTFPYFIWFQGEANVGGGEKVGGPPTYYEQKLMTIINTISSGWTPEVIVVGIWREDMDASGFRTFQQEMCNRHENFHFVDSRELPRSDGVHLTGKGQRMLARRINQLLLTIESR